MGLVQHRFIRSEIMEIVGFCFIYWLALLPQEEKSMCVMCVYVSLDVYTCVCG